MRCTSEFWRYHHGKRDLLWGKDVSKGKYTSKAYWDGSGYKAFACVLDGTSHNRSACGKQY